MTFSHDSEKFKIKKSIIKFQVKLSELTFSFSIN